jgi:hypothetical protein
MEFEHAKIKKTRIDNLSISWDYETDPKKRCPVFLFTLDMCNTDVHYHIKLSIAEARALKKWLNDFLTDHDGRKSKMGRNLST